MARGHVIDRVTLRGDRIADPAAGRSWSQRTLAATDLDDVVAPAATLVLRAIALKDGSPGPALARAARDAARTAARPAAGPVGAGAGAVLFADDAELLACIARDLIDGSFVTAWWWASHRREGGAATAIVGRAWVRRPLAAPAALHTLSRDGRAGALLRALPEPALRELAAAAAAAGLVPHDTVAHVLSAWSAPAREQPNLPPRAAADDPLPARADVRRIPPRVLAGAAGDVAPAQGSAAVLGVALLLAHRAPAVLRDIASAAIDRAIACAAAAAEPEPGVAAPVRAPARGATPSGPAATTSPRMAAEPERGVPARSGASAGHDRAGGSDPFPRSHAEPRPRPHSLPRSPAARPAPVAGFVPDTRGGSAPRVAHSGPRPLASPSAPIAGAAPARESPSPTIARTPLAGAFLLLTVAQDLGLYPDFTRPRDRGLEISPWTWLAHTTAQLVGVRDPADPLWALLRELAGEPDGPAPGRAPQLRTVTRRVARRLDGALGRRGSAGHVVLRPGAVHAGPTRVDVVFALDMLDVAIRRCGLDRDPGWLPAAARDIRLHYR